MCPSCQLQDYTLKHRLKEYPWGDALRHYVVRNHQGSIELLAIRPGHVTVDQEVLGQS